MDQNTQTLGYTFPDFDKEVMGKLNALRIAAKKTFSVMGKQNQPLPAETEFGPVIASVKASHEGLHAECMNKIKPEVHHAQFKAFAENKEKKMRELDAEAQKLAHENLIDEHELDGKPCPQPLKSNRFAMALLILMYIGETYYNAMAIEFYGDIPIGAYFIGFVITAIEAVLAYYIGRNLDRLKDEGKKIDLKTGAAIALVASIIASMTTLRSHAAAALDSTLPSWVYFFINVGMVVATVIFSRKVFPSRKMSEANEMLCEKYAKVKERKQRIAAIEQEKKQLDTDYNEKKNDYDIVMSQVMRAGEIIRVNFRETAEHAKAENCIMRSDRQIPLCFRAPVPELELSTFNPEEHA